MFIYSKERGLVINLDKFDTIEITKDAAGKLDVSAVRFDGQLRIATIIEKFDREADAINLMQQLVDRLAYSDHVMVIQRDYVSKINNLGQTPKQ